MHGTHSEITKGTCTPAPRSGTRLAGAARRLHRLALPALLTAVLATLLLAGCGGGSQRRVDPATAGGIAATVIWPGGAGPLGARMQPYTVGQPLPAGVAWVRLTASDELASFTPIVATFPATDRGGAVQGIPEGDGRILTVEALNAAQTSVLYSGTTGLITVTAGGTAMVTVNMVLVATNLAVTSPGAASPYYANTPLAALAGTCATVSDDAQVITLSAPGQPSLQGPCTANAFSFDLAGGGWSFTPNAPATVLTLQQSSTFGGGSRQITWSYVYDTLAPGAPGAVTPGGTSAASPLVTGGNALTLTGTCEAGNSVVVSEGGIDQAVTCDSNGQFSIIVVRLSDGTYSLLVTQRDAAGNASAGVTVYWQRDTSVPPPPTGLAVSAPTPVNGSYLTAPVSQITVTCLAGNAGTLYEDGTLLGGPSGTSCTGAPQAIAVTGTATTDGTRTYSAKQTDLATGIVSASASVVYTLDTVSPLAPAITSPTAVAAQGTGSYQSPETVIPLVGTCESGASVHLWVGGVDTQQGTCSSGSFSLSYDAGGVVNATVVLELTQTDLAGHSSAPTYTKTKLTWVAGVVIPPAPVITSPAATSYGTAALASITVTCDATGGYTLTAYQDGGSTALATQACNASPRTLTLSGATSAAGTHTYTVRQTHPVTGLSSSASITYVIDVTAPDSPSFTQPVAVAARGTGSYGSAETLISLAGACETNATVHLWVGGVDTQQVTCSSGSYGTSYNAGAVSDQLIVLELTQTDLAGNSSSPSFTKTKLSWTAGASAPATPTITVPAAATAYGNTALAGITATCTAGNTLFVYEDGATSALASGPCSSSPQALALSGASATPATHTYDVKQAAFGTVFSAAATLTYVLDTTAPPSPSIATPVPVAAGDTGSYSSTATSLTVTGGCETGATVQFYDGTTQVATDTCVSASYSVSYTPAGGPGAYVLKVGQTDPAGNASATASRTRLDWTLTSGPAAPTITSPASSPTYGQGPLTSIVATCAGSNLVGVFEDGSGTPLATGTCSGGSATVNFTGSSAQASHSYDARQSADGGSTYSAAATIVYIVDTTPPASPSLTSPVSAAADSTGATYHSSTTQITLTGACESGAIVHLWVDTVDTKTAACSSNSYSVITPAGSANTTYVLELTQKDPAQNDSTPTHTKTKLTWTAGVATPATPVISSPAATSYGNTGLAAMTVTCAADGNHTVFVYEDGSTTALHSETCTGSPLAMTLSGATTAVGAHTYSVRQADFGTVFSAAASITYIIDTTPPGSPSISSPAPVAAQGTSTYVSTETSIMLAGGCESGATAHLWVGGVDTTTGACASGAYSIAYGPVSAGDYTLELSQVDPAGNSSYPIFVRTKLTWTAGAAVPATPTVQSPAAISYGAVALGAMTVTCTTSGSHTVYVYQDGSGTALHTQACSGSPLAMTLTGASAAEGSHTYTVRQESGGIFSGSVTITYVVDTTVTAPVLTGPVAVAAGGSGTYSTGAVNSITLAGTCEAEATVSIAGSAAKTTACASAGTFSTSVSAFADGTYTYLLSQTDLAGNVSGQTSLAWTRQTVVPPTPTIDSPSSEPTYSNVALPSLSGTCATGYTVTLSGAQNGATTCASSQYSFTLAAPSADGTYKFFVSQTDAGGQTSAAAQRTWVFDTLKPAAVTLTNPTVTPLVTANTTNLLLTGGCETGATVTLSNAGTGSQTCSNSQFGFSVSQSVDGTYAYTLVQTDPAGNSSTAVTQTWIRNSAIPETPTITLPTAMPVYSNNSTTPSYGTAPTYVNYGGGTAANGDVVIAGTCTYLSAGGHTVFLDDGLTDLAVAGVTYPYQADCQADGTFAITLQNQTNHWVWDPLAGSNGQGTDTGARPAGTYTFTLFQQKNADSTNSAGVFVQAIIDLTAPAAPALSSPTAVPAGGSASFAGPGPIALGGTCESNATVKLSDDGGTSTRASATCSSGAFSLTGVDELIDGAYVYDLFQTDRAGNTSAHTVLTWTRNSQLVPMPTITFPTSNPYISNLDVLNIIGTCSSGMSVHLDGASTQITTCVGGGYSFQVGPLSDGTYSFSLSQEVGGVFSTALALSWTLDTSTPVLVADYALPFATDFPGGIGSDLGLVVGNPVTNPAQDAVFQFHESTSDPAATFECNMDGAGYSACISPLVLTGLASGVTHSIAIRAKDGAGNASATPFERYWTQQSHKTVALYQFDEASGSSAADSALYLSDTPAYDGTLTAIGTDQTNDIVAGPGTIGSVGGSGGTAVSGFGNARSLTAADTDYLTHGDEANVAGVRTKMTVEAVVRPDFLTSAPGNKGEKVIASKWDATNQRPAWTFGFYQRGGAANSKILLFFRTYTETLDATGAVVISQQFYLSSNTSSLNASSSLDWVHVAVTWNRGVVTFFENGNRLNSRTLGIAGTSLLPDGDGALYVGASGTTGTAGPTLSRFLDGEVDELRISQDLCYLTGVGTPPTGPFTNADCVADQY